jgi:uncharacterized protein YegL
MKKILKIIALVLFSIQPFVAKADGVFKIKSDLKKYLLPHKVAVQTTVNDHLALTKTRQFFKNTHDSAATVQYAFPVPTNARVIGFSWWLNSVENKAVLVENKAVLVEQKQDTAAANVTGSADEVFISYAGTNPFLINILTPFEPNAEITVELQYIELLDNFKGNVAYNYPMKVFLKEEFEFDLDIKINSSWGVEKINCDYFVGEFLKNDSGATGKIHVAKVTQGRNVTIHYKTSGNRYGLSLLTHKKEDEDGFYLMQVRPQSKGGNGDSLKRSIVFLMDISESMRGGKAKFMKEAVSYCLNNLSGNDQFNILEFNETTPTRFKDFFSAVTSNNITEAQNYVQNRLISGKTNITNAVISAMDEDFPADAVKMIVIFTDGHDKINLGAIANKNLLKKVAIYTCATGSDAEKLVLKNLAEQNSGETQAITYNNQQVSIQEFFGKIQNPVALKPEIEVSPVHTYERFPLLQPDIYAGEQLQQLGRYQSGGDADIVIKGKTFTGDVSYSFKGNFATASGGDSLLPKIWAKYKIEELHDLILKNPSDPNKMREWRKEIIAMSLKYTIVSPYTSFRDQGKNDTLAVDTSSGGGETTSVEVETRNDFATIEAYPNPSAEDIFISLKLDGNDGGKEIFNIEIYSATGELVQQLYSGKLSGKKHYFYWDGIDAKGRRAPSGMYLCRVTAGGKSSFLKIFINR